MDTFKLITLALLTTGSALPGVAYAQSAPAPAEVEVEDIIVTGYVQSLIDARNLKRDADIVRDVIIAEDMAKFPELNLAESIQRLPGVAINREAGEGRRISLRGLGSDFTRVQLNGMEVLGNVDSAMDSRGQRSRDRAFDFNIFASELFSRVEVEKTFQAAQKEGGMAGTVGLFTAKPLDYDPGLKGAISTKLGTNSYTKDAQPRVAGMLGYNWDDSFGVLVSVAYSKRNTEEQGYNVYSPSQLSAARLKGYVDAGLDISALSPAEQAKFLSGDLIFASGNRNSVWNAEQERLGLTMAMQWRPADNLLLTLDGLHGRFTTHRNEYHLATRPDSTSGSVAFDIGSKINAIRWDETNFVSSIDVDNATYASEHRRSLNKNRFSQIALTGQWEANDRLTVDGHIGYEKSTYRTPYDDKLYLRATGGMTTTFAPSGTSARNVYNWDTTDPSRYRFKEFYFREFWNQTSLREGELNARYDLDNGIALRVGAAYHRYQSSGQEIYNDGKGHEHSGTPVDGYSYVFDQHRSIDWIVGDYAKAFDRYNMHHTVAGATDIENTFRITETTTSGYGQIDWNTDLGGMRLRGNIGLRAYFTDTKNVGLILNSNYTPIGEETRTSDYSGLLPAFNAALEITPEFIVRVAATKNINRPSLGSLGMQGSVTRNDDGSFDVSVGNPDLKPYKDTALDLSAEWYFGKVGMVSVGVFHKNIKNLIAGETFYNVPFSQTGLSTDLIGGLPASTEVREFSRPINMARAKLTGLELAAQTQFSFLPAPFDGLGAMANFTYIDPKQPINGLSKYNANATLYYETKNWGLRGSLNYRSRYLRAIYDGTNPHSEGGFDGTIYVDAAAFVNLMPGLRLTVDVINLTNEKEVQYHSIHHRLHNVTQSGTTVLAGINYTF